VGTVSRGEGAEFFGWIKKKKKVLRREKGASLTGFGRGNIYPLGQTEKEGRFSFQRKKAGEGEKIISGTHVIHIVWERKSTMALASRSGRKRADSGKGSREGKRGLGKPKTERPMISL